MWRNTNYEKYRNWIYELSWIDQDKKERLKNVQVVDIYISKNRMGTARVIETYKIDFNQGGQFIKATEEEKMIWKTAWDWF
jgi:hypothetical protein